MEMINIFDIGLRIKELRKLNNMTSNQLAINIGISQPQLSRIENNVNMATFETIDKVCNIFNISLVDFFNNDSSNTIIPSHFKEFINKNKDLTPLQLEALSKFIDTLKK